MKAASGQANMISANREYAPVSSAVIAAFGGERDPLAFPPPQRELVAGVGVGAAVAAGAELASDLHTSTTGSGGRVVDPFGHEWEIGRPLSASRSAHQR
jgi:hypothetical protein